MAEQLLFVIQKRAILLQKPCANAYNEAIVVGLRVSFCVRQDRVEISENREYSGRLDEI